MPDFKRVLSPFVGAVTLLFGLFGGVLKRIAPPDSGGLALAVGMVPFLLLLIFLMVTAWSSQLSSSRTRKLWLFGGTVLALVSVPACFVYPTTLDRYTYIPGDDAKGRRVHASQDYLTPEAKAYLQANPEDAAPDRLARNFESNDMVWQKHGMEIAEQRLMGAYIWLVLSLCLAIFCFVQATGSYASSADKPPARKGKDSVTGTVRG